MLVLVLCILALVTPAFFGGKMSRLAFVRFKAWWILVVALLSQILIIEVFPDADRTMLEVVHMATYVAAGVFVAINWRIPGLLVIAAGGAMNGVTIALNGGQLPASKPALEMAGIEVAKGEFSNSGVIKDSVLPVFGDIFVWPEPLPFANVFSFGDALIVFGVFYGAHKIAGSRLVKKPWQLPVDALAAGESQVPAASAAEAGQAPEPRIGPRHSAARPAVISTAMETH
ncbi:MAG: DUF5317 domain-containing protein [Actinomycetia bacterium]|nr:DUF5317 domain-containing protein [Actinomycetes bacterium]